MYNDWFYLEQSRVQREQERVRRMAGRAKCAQLRAARLSLRARLARRLFALAVAAERQETWKVVWERLEAKGRL